MYEIKPKKSASFTFPLITGIIVKTIVLLIYVLLTISLNTIFIISGLVVYLLWVSLSYVFLKKKYEKALTLIYPDKIISKSGGIFNDSETELIIKNITNIKLSLPYLYNKFFKTGNISVESAGSGGVEIFLSQIEDADKWYDLLLKVMSNNGFSLNMDNKLISKKPKTIAIILDLLMIYGGIIVGLIFFLLPLLTAGVGIFSYMMNNILFFILSILLGVFLLMILSIFPILRFFDMKKRKYIVYEDAATFSEGFLSKRFITIPAENISDSSINRNFISRLIGVSDVKISCQGTGSEINFTNMENAKELEQIIEKISQKNSLANKKSNNLSSKSNGLNSILKLNNVSKKEENKKEENKKRSKSKKNLEYLDEAVMMDKKRVFKPLYILLPFCAIIFVLLPVWILIYIQAWITYSSTKYYLKPSRIVYHYKFIQEKSIEFNYEKITSVMITQGIIDRIFNTINIKLV
ncbi:MAG: PH domain-containing protein, partial [bacterium]